MSLPVFRATTHAGDIFYAPGCVMWAGDRKHPPRELEDAATEAVRQWEAQARTEFRPVCLTLNLTNRCTLGCSYCFAAGPERETPLDDLALPAIAAAAELVIGCCGARQMPFQLVLTGGGEPTLAWSVLDQTVAVTRRISASHGVAWRSYLATNGSVPEDRLRWLARNIDKISLSCDGPPEIHDAQRSRSGRDKSCAAVEHAASVIREEGGCPVVRATITPASMLLQSKVVRWLNEHLGAREIRFEPVYTAPPGLAFRAEDAGTFAREFLAAQQTARSLGCELSISGVRLDELHGPHCNVLKDVLHLRPDGTATACFLSSGGASPRAQRHTIGRFDAANGRYLLDRQRIAALRVEAAIIPEGCASCLNAHHCARSCPDRCILDSPSEAKTPDFRCLVARRLTELWLQEVAGSLRSTARTLPVPLWGRRGFPMNGREAWDALSAHIEREPTSGPLSIYVHIPFCRRRCGFCDCYSESTPDAAGPKVRAFEDALAAEIETWQTLASLRSRPVTTVHFGGGTPNGIAPEILTRIVARLRSAFARGPTTEWALESGSSLLNAEHLGWLRDLGFTRLHVGIQTLEEGVRRAIGRREGTEQAMLHLGQAIQAGFIVSVDLIYGLPGQTMEGWLATIKMLAGTGVDGFSLYGLQVTDRNRRFLASLEGRSADMAGQFALFQAAHDALLADGFRKNHFAHFARERDLDLYYRYAARGEDLLALGPSADGALGAFLYRHPPLKEYLEGVAPAVEGALEMSDRERIERAAEAAILCNCIRRAEFETLGAEPLLNQWLNEGLVERSLGNGGYELTVAGSWQVSRMVRSLCEHK